MSQGRSRRTFTKEFKTFLNAFMRMPCQILRTGRRLIYRLLSWNPWQQVFLRGVDALHAMSAWRHPCGVDPRHQTSGYGRSDSRWPLNIRKARPQMIERQSGERTDPWAGRHGRRSRPMRPSRNQNASIYACIGTSSLYVYLWHGRQSPCSHGGTPVPHDRERY